MPGWPDGVRGDADRQAARRVDRAGEHLRERLPAELPGEERLHDRGGVVGERAERVRPAGEQHQDDRGARVEQRPDQVGLDAGQVQVGGVAALAGRAAAEQPGPVADRDDAHVGVAGGGDGRGEPRAVGVGDVAAAGVGDVSCALAQRVEDRRDLDAEPVLRVVHADVRGERVAAEHRHRVVGERADERDPRVGPQREGPSRVGQQDDRPRGPGAAPRRGSRSSSRTRSGVRAAG